MYKTRLDGSSVKLQMTQQDVRLLAKATSRQDSSNILRGILRKNAAAAALPRVVASPAPGAQSQVHSAPTTKLAPLNREKKAKSRELYVFPGSKGREADTVEMPSVTWSAPYPNRRMDFSRAQARRKSLPEARTEANPWVARRALGRLGMPCAHESRRPVEKPPPTKFTALVTIIVFCKRWANRARRKRWNDLDGKLIKSIGSLNNKWAKRETSEEMSRRESIYSQNTTLCGKLMRISVKPGDEDTQTYGVEMRHYVSGAATQSTVSQLDWAYLIAKTPDQMHQDEKVELAKDLVQQTLRTTRRIERMIAAGVPTSFRTNEEFGTFLGAMGVDAHAFGVGNAKPLSEFREEVENGDCYLEVRSDGRLLRVVHVVNAVVQKLGSTQTTLQLDHKVGTDGVVKRLQAHKRIPAGQVRGELLHLLKGGGINTVAEKNRLFEKQALDVLAKALGMSIDEIGAKVKWTQEQTQTAKVRLSNAFPGVPGQYVVHTLRFRERFWGSFAEPPAGCVWANRSETELQDERKST